MLLLGGSAPHQGLRQVRAAGIVLQQPVAARLRVDREVAKVADLITVDSIVDFVERKLQRS